MARRGKHLFWFAPTATALTLCGNLYCWPDRWGSCVRTEGAPEDGWFRQTKALTAAETKFWNELVSSVQERLTHRPATARRKRGRGT